MKIFILKLIKKIKNNIEALIKLKNKNKNFPFHKGSEKIQTVLNI
jgi:hypothetical protein